MYSKKLERRLLSMNSIAKRVFLAVPVGKPALPKDIVTELHRQHPATVDIRVVKGCLDTLTKSRLIKENPRGNFTRDEVDDSLRRKLIGPSEGSAAPKPQVQDHKPPVKEVTPVVDACETPEASAQLVTEDEPAVAREELLALAESSQQMKDLTYTVEVPWTHEDEIVHFTYIDMRFRRNRESMLALSEVLDEQAGLALLDILEDMEGLQGVVDEFMFLKNDPVKRLLKPVEGAYIHEVLNEVFITEDPTPPSEDSVREMLEGRPAALDKMNELLREACPGWTERAEESAKDQARWEAAALDAFEPEGSSSLPYLTAMMERLTSLVPEAEPVADVKVLQVASERRSQRNTCDVKAKGISLAPEYRAWANITSQSNLRLLELDGLGVSGVWLRSMAAFIADVGYRPALTAKLTRINREEGWYPDNVEWRVGGFSRPGLKRKPNGWPATATRDSVLKKLDICKKTVKNKKVA